MQQRSPQPTTPTAQDSHKPPIAIKPAPDDQLQKLSMLDGSARLRVAEQRVRDGLGSPHIDVQQPSESAPLHVPSRKRGATVRSPTASRAKWIRGLLFAVAILLLGGALLLKLMK